MSRAESDRDRVLRLGREALKTLDSGKDWQAWLAVGRALMIGREECKRDVGLEDTNLPPNKYGARYNRMFSHWLEEHSFNHIDAGDRSRLLQVMDNLDRITAWRETLTEGERRRLNHPSTVLRQFKRKTEVKPRPQNRRSRSGERAKIEKILNQLGSDQSANAALKIYEMAKQKKQLVAEFIRDVFA